jgi:prepilin-type N-terminal cleavage/methylation domain-containing protein
MFSHRVRWRWRAFTLVELLVVVLIIGIIASLTAGAAVLVIGRQKSSNTETNIKLLATALDEHYRAVIDKASKEPPLPEVVALAGGDTQRAQVIWVKLRLKQEFPMTFAELLAPAGSSGIPLPPSTTYVEALQQQLGPTGVAQINPGLQVQPCEPAVCLLLALQKNRRGVNFDMDSLSPGTVADGTYTLPDGSTATVKQLVDSWGAPLAFYRWPTACTELGPQVGFNDPEDPTGLLCSPTWQSQFGSVFVQSFHALAPPASGQPQSYRLIPTIVSAGPNNFLGMPPDPKQPAITGWTPNPMDTSQPDSSDNIYSYRMLSLGARGGS